MIDRGAQEQMLTGIPRKKTIFLNEKSKAALWDYHFGTNPHWKASKNPQKILIFLIFSKM